MVTLVQKMEKDVETKRRKLNVSGIDEKNQKYLKQLKGSELIVVFREQVITGAARVFEILNGIVIIRNFRILTITNFLLM